MMIETMQRGILYYGVWVALLTLGSAILVLFIPTIKGKLGEKKVANILETLSSKEYKTINNVMLKTERGSTQIDHIVISIYGIFVIETKNYKGWITGNDYSEKWTKNMYGRKYRFMNPLKQNYGHVKNLEKLLNLSSEYFIPIVVFSNNSNLKIKTSNEVIYMSKLKNTILKYKERKLSIEDLNKYVSLIIGNNIDSKENRKKHVDSIKTTIKESANKEKNGICPKCGAKLVKKKGKYGYFLGCSNYPKCKYIGK